MLRITVELILNARSETLGILEIDDDGGTPEFGNYVIRQPSPLISRQFLHYQRSLGWLPLVEHATKVWRIMQE